MIELRRRLFEISSDHLLVCIPVVRPRRTSLPPGPILELYRESNGLRLKPLGVSFIPLTEVSKYIAGFDRFGFSRRWGYFPFTDANDSNPYCICCRSPLTGRIVHVFHDDDPRLDFRDLDSFLAAILKLTRDNESELFDELPAQYDDSTDRTPADVEAGLELLETARNLPDDDLGQDQLIIYGVRLLPDANVAEFARLLDGGPYVREAALKRLEGIPAPEAKAALSAYQRAWNKFRDDAVAGLRRAGITVEEVKDDCVLIQPNHVWLNLDSFYEDHREPGIFDRIVDRARQFVSERRD